MSLIGGRYKPLLDGGARLLQLYPARDTVAQSDVLVRRLIPRDASARQRILRDCRAVARLQHQGLARVLDVLEQDGEVVLVLDALQGRPLSEAASSRGLPVALVVQALAQLAAALDFAHGQGIYVGSLDPGGIVLTPQDQVLIADVVSEELETLEVPVTPYRAPEAAPNRPARAAQDLYSLGAIGWLLATGAPPRQRSLPADLPPSLNELLHKLLEDEPGRRPATARTVLQALRPDESGRGFSMWKLLFTPLWPAKTASERPTAVPEDEGEHARQARDTFPEHSLESISRELARRLPETVARSIAGVIVGESEGQLELALKDPTFVHAHDYVRMALGDAKLRFFRAEPQLVEQALEYVYRADVYSEAISWPEWLVRRRFHGLPLQIDNPIADTSIWGEPLPSRVIDAVDTILKEALAVGASDVHLETGRRWLDLRYRIDGVLRHISRFPPEQAAAMVKRIKVLANLDIAQERVPQGGRMAVRVGELECDLRVSLVPVHAGENAVLRVLRKSGERLSLPELGFPSDLLDQYQGLLEQPYGMLVVCGPTGSGKTTTLYSSLKVVERPDRKVLTVEDPIEYEIAGITQVQVDTAPREPEKKVTFARVLREFLRQDPDVILVGEMRDPETAEVAVQAALTGHLVLSTLHANSALGIFPRLREMGIEPFLIGSAMLGCLAQRLARRICPDCREEVEVPSSMRERMELAGIDQPRAYRGVGCPACLNTGSRGRVGIYELVAVTPELRALLLDGAGENELAGALSYRRLHEHGLQLAARGSITLDEVLRVTRTL